MYEKFDKKRLNDKIDYDSVFDPNLSEEEYSEKLDNLLREYGKNLVERRTIIRQKLQEFREKTRTTDSRERWEKR